MILFWVRPRRPSFISRPLLLNSWSQGEKEEEKKSCVPSRMGGHFRLLPVMPARSSSALPKRERWRSRFLDFNILDSVSFWDHFKFPVCAAQWPWPTNHSRFSLHKDWTLVMRWNDCVFHFLITNPFPAYLLRTLGHKLNLQNYLCWPTIWIKKSKQNLEKYRCCPHWTRRKNSGWKQFVQKWS